MESLTVNCDTSNLKSPRGQSIQWFLAIQCDDRTILVTRIDTTISVLINKEHYFTLF